MIQRIAEALLIGVFHPVSAVVSLGAGEKVLGVWLFDTMAGSEHMHIEADSTEIWLISNHPEGCDTPYEADWRNACRLTRLAKGIRVRFFMASEYFACREMRLFDQAADVL